MAEQEPRQEADALGLRIPDYVASAAKSILGAAPFAGPFLAEIAGSIIPNQRVDRLMRFAVNLEEKLAHLDQIFVRAQLTDENFTDVMEESIRQAARSVTEDRRSYIASVIAKGLSPDSIKFAESRHILRILGEISDVEVLWLRKCLVNVVDGDHEFRERHSGIFRIPPPHVGCSQEVSDRNALKESYLQHLTQLGLLSPVRHSPQSTDNPSVAYYELTRMGRLLLRQIGLLT